MKRVFYEKIGQYLGREIRILKLLGHGRRHYRISGQGSADNYVLWSNCYSGRTLSPGRERSRGSGFVPLRASSFGIKCSQKRNKINGHLDPRRLRAEVLIEGVRQGLALFQDHWRPARVEWEKLE